MTEETAIEPTNPDGEDCRKCSTERLTDGSKSSNEKPKQNSRPSFEPTENPDLPPGFSFPEDEPWLNVLSAPCTFSPEIFNDVMFSLVKNPNLTSTYLFRADIFYDSDTDRLKDSGNSLVDHLKPEYRPIPATWPNFTLTRTLVRQLIPRNPQVDSPLLQTCHFFVRHHHDPPRTDSLVLYIPHVTSPSSIPFYHPTLLRLAFLQTSPPSGAREISILYLPFPSPSPSALSPKLSRTALHLLSTLHKHGHGLAEGYVKHARHDVVVPQRRYQETYARLKKRYGRELARGWREATDPGKHVFEDLGIAAWLIEVWRDTYFHFRGGGGGGGGEEEEEDEGEEWEEGKGEGEGRRKWRGFVDIGCGNGLLTYILLEEGCGPGWGFDARERKSWGEWIGALRRDGEEGGGVEAASGMLERRVLVPRVLSDRVAEERTKAGNKEGFWHDGDFEEGVFIISNHADQLTVWTPLLACLNSSGFAAIPCCSHDFSGARFRAPVASSSKKKHRADDDPGETAKPVDGTDEKVNEKKRNGIAEEGSLAPKTSTKGKIPTPSAYKSLCTYVESLADEVGFKVETETLRIPSTRNGCILGRKWKKPQSEVTPEEKQEMVTRIVEREMKKGIDQVAEEWIGRVEGLMEKPGSGH